MLIIGLTGSIATGKTTVSRILSSPPYNLPVVDADVLARKVVEPGTPGYTAVVDYFLPTTPDLLLPPAEGDDAGKQRPLNRAVLGRRVFGDDAQRRKDRAILSGIIHPLVRKEIYKSILKAHFTGQWAIVLDIPLLFESHLDLLCGAVITVSVSSTSTQLQRLLSRDAASGGTLTPEDAQNRIASQMGLREKEELTEGVFGGSRERGWVLKNDGSLEDLEKGVGNIMERIREGRDGWWKWVLVMVPAATGAVGIWIVVENWWRRRNWERGVKAKL